MEAGHLDTRRRRLPPDLPAHSRPDLARRPGEGERGNLDTSVPVPREPVELLANLPTVKHLVAVGPSNHVATVRSPGPEGESPRQFYAARILPTPCPEIARPRGMRAHWGRLQPDDQSAATGHTSSQPMTVRNPKTLRTLSAWSPQAHRARRPTEPRPNKGSSVSYDNAKIGQGFPRGLMNIAQRRIIERHSREPLSQLAIGLRDEPLYRTPLDQVAPFEHEAAVRRGILQPHARRERRPVSPDIFDRQHPSRISSGSTRTAARS